MGQQSRRVRGMTRWGLTMTCGVLVALGVSSGWWCFRVAAAPTSRGMLWVELGRLGLFRINDESRFAPPTWFEVLPLPPEHRARWRWWAHFETSGTTDA